MRVKTAPNFRVVFWRDGTPTDAPHRVDILSNAHSNRMIVDIYEIYATSEGNAVNKAIKRSTTPHTSVEVLRLP